MVTATPFEYTDYVRPACLPSQGFKIEHEATCVISGWGKTHQGRVSKPDGSNCIRGVSRGDLWYHLSLLALPLGRSADYLLHREIHMLD